MSWPVVKLKDCCQSIADGDHQAPPKVDQGVPFITISNIIHNELDFTNTMFVPESYYNSIDNKRRAKKGDILYSVVGSFGIPVLITEDKKFSFQRHIAILRPNISIIDKYFLYYTMLCPDFYAMADAVAIGAAQRTISLNSLRNLEIKLPLLNIQKKIVNILSPYDALIKNNNKQIKLLEEAAQRLYKEWFSDLRFPGHESTKIVDGVPEGWEVCAIDDICSLRKTVIKAQDIPHGIPYIGLEHIPRKDFCLSSWGNSSEIFSNKYQYEENDILFGKIRPYFHKVGFSINKGVASTDTIIMVARDNSLWGLLLLSVFSEEFVRYSYQNCKEGAKMPRADWNIMKKYKILKPEKNILTKFNTIILRITEKIKKLALQNKIAREARNILLPQLMNNI